MDDLTLALQITGLIALVLFIIMVLCLIPAIFGIKRQLAEFLSYIKNLETELHEIASDSRQLVQNVNELATKVNNQVDAAGRIVDNAVQWSDMANRVVTGVATIIEPPISGLARNISIFRLGMNVFMNALRSKKTNNPKKQEDENV